MRWEVKWDGTTWDDITPLAHVANVEHGEAAYSNPDRPILLTARGRIVIRDVPPHGVNARYPIRLVDGSTSVWAGVLSGPSRISGVLPSWEWRLSAADGPRLEREMDRTLPARSVSAMMGDPDFWAYPLGYAPTVVGGLPARSITEHDYAGPVGGFLSHLGLVTSMLICETRSGKVRYVNPAPTTIPGVLPLIDSGIRVSHHLTTIDREDRIRNQFIVEGTSRGEVVYASDAESVAIWGARPIRMPQWIYWDTTIARQLIGQLARLRRQHTITVPTRQPTAAATSTVTTVDAGDYVTVRLVADRLGVHISHTCVIVGRKIRWSQDRPTTITLRLLELAEYVPPVSYLIAETGGGLLWEDSGQIELEAV